MTEAVGTFFRLKGNNRVAVSMIKPSKDGRGYVVALQNLRGNPVRTGFVNGRIKVREARISDFRENTVKVINPDDFWMQPYEYVRIKINCDI